MAGRRVQNTLYTFPPVDKGAAVDNSVGSFHSSSLFFVVSSLFFLRHVFSILSFCGSNSILYGVKSDTLYFYVIILLLQIKSVLYLI